MRFRFSFSPAFSPTPPLGRGPLRRSARGLSQVLTGFGLIRPAGVIKGLEILGHLDRHLFTLAFGDVPTCGLVEVMGRLVEAHERDIPC